MTHAPHPPSLFSVELRTARWEQLVDWYRDVLGLKVLLRVVDDHYALLDAGCTRLAIMGRATAGEASGRWSLGFETDDLDAAWHRLGAAASYRGSVFRHFWLQRQLRDNASAFEDPRGVVEQPGLTMHHAPFPPTPAPDHWLAVLRGGFQHYAYTWAHRGALRAFLRPAPDTARALLRRGPSAPRASTQHGTLPFSNT